METPAVLRLVIAMVLGYAILFFVMWLFSRKKENGKKSP